MPITCRGARTEFSVEAEMKPVEPEEVKTSVGNKQDTCKQS